MIRYALPALLFAAALPAHAQAPVDHPPLIERAKIFGNPSKSGGRISPDGKWLSWIAPRDGVLNVWVAPASDLAQARPLTQEKVPQQLLVARFDNPAVHPGQGRR